MRVHLIAGMPAAGKDTLADIIEEELGSRKVSMSRDVLTPLIKIPEYRERLSEDLGVDLSFIDEDEYPVKRDGLIRLGDDLNQALREEGYHHFSDIAVETYGPELVIPSFRQAEMLPHLENNRIPHNTYLIQAPEEIRHQRWKERDNITEEDMQGEDQVEREKYLEPLKNAVDFDYVVDNSGPRSHLYEFVASELISRREKHWTH